MRRKQVTSVKIDIPTHRKLLALQRKLSFVQGTSLSLCQVIDHAIGVVEQPNNKTALTANPEPEAVHA